MGIYQRNGNYYIDYRYQNQRIREMVGLNKRDAEKALAIRKAEILQGRYRIQRRGDERLEAFSKVYMDYSKANKRSWVRDQTSFNNLIPFFGNRLLGDITPFLIEKYKMKRVKEAKPASVNRELALLKHMYTMAIKWGKATGNPVKEVKLFREENIQERILARNEIARLLKACSPYSKPIVLTALHTGMRRGEILSLKWAQVDMAQRVITVIHTKNGKVRKIPINGILWLVLNGLQAKKTSEYVFIYDKYQRPIHDFRTAWANALKRAEIAPCRFHDLRHTFASHLVAAGADLVTVKELLGHSTILTTMRYAHSAPQTKRDAVSLLNERFDVESGHYVDTQTSPRRMGILR